VKNNIKKNKMNNKTTTIGKVNTISNSINRESTSIMYLEVDISQTEKRFKQYANDYNEELYNPTFLKEQFCIHQKFKVQVQESRKSLAIKSTTIIVAMAIVKAYFNHLRLVGRGKLLKEPKFTMNNIAIATMTGMSDRSVRVNFQHKVD